MSTPPGAGGGWNAPQPGFYFSPPPQPSRASPVAIVAGFVGVLLLIAVIVMVIVFVSQPPPPVAPCEPGVPCRPPASHRPVAAASPRGSAPTPAPGTPRPDATAGPGNSPSPPGPVASPFVPPATPTSDAPPVISGEVWQSAELGFSFEYDGGHFSLGEVTEGTVALNGVFFDALVRVHGEPASTSPAEMIESELALVDRFVLGRAPDTDDYDALLGPSIGYLSGEGAVFSGTLVSRDGTPLEPAGVTILASSDGRITVAVTVIVGTPDLRLGSDTHQHAVRQAADHILKTFDWDTSR